MFYNPLKPGIDGKAGSRIEYCSVTKMKYQKIQKRKKEKPGGNRIATPGLAHAQNTTDWKSWKSSQILLKQSAM